ncbi:glyoxalase [Demetria terragena]|uniref:glyoxalase n=1 Tax=Demetria terragena TaxID=63959 RepID=UPI0004757CF1|nr:glyoxalase [Demetria terragena]
MSQRADTNIWPLLTSSDALALRAWLAGLGFEEGVCVPGDQEDSVMHSEMLWPDGGRLMVCTAADTNGHLKPPGQAGCYVVLRDVEAVHARALAIGAEITRPLENASSYESRGFSLRTPEGHSISFGTYAG